MNQEGTINSAHHLNHSPVTIHMYDDPGSLMMRNHYHLPLPLVVANSGHYMSIPIKSMGEYVCNVNDNNNGCQTLSTRRSSQPRLRPAKSTGALNSSSSSSSTASGSPPIKGNCLEDNEIYQIERFYMAHKTFVYVSRCMANLYFTKTDLINDGRLSSPRSHEWQLDRTGVPVIIFDKGETKARDRRQLRLCLAERGTGFNLWSDVIDNLTDYKAVHPCFHTLYLSCDHRKMAGLSFDSGEAATEFLRKIESITCDPVNIALSGPKRNSKKEAKSCKSKRGATKLPRKEAISSPCLFQHVINVDLKDIDRLHSITSLVPHRVFSSGNPELRSLSSLNAMPFQSASPLTVVSTASNSSEALSVKNHCS